MLIIKYLYDFYIIFIQYKKKLSYTDISLIKFLYNAKIISISHKQFTRKILKIIKNIRASNNFFSDFY